MKLFRSLRQVLIKKGNVRRYLLYAIGEIFLVMIGISLAFQVDNWNDGRIQKNAEQNFYRNFINQIEDDKGHIQSQIDFNNFYMVRFKFLSQSIANNDRTKLDSLGAIVRELVQYSDFDRQGNIYETTVNSGEIKLIRNRTIINNIRNLEEKYMYLNRMENIHYDAIMSKAVIKISSVIDFSNSNVKKIDELYSYEFNNLVILLIQIMTEKNEVYNESLEQIDQVNELIETELLKFRDNSAIK